MSTLAILDLAIGLTFIYASFSLACSALVEWLSAVVGRRHRLLRKSICDLLGSDLIKAFDGHQMIKGLRRYRWLAGQNQYPDYIPDETFALVFMSLTMDFTPGAPGTPGHVALKQSQTGPRVELAEALMQGTNNVGAVQARIQRWFADAMETTSGKYKRGAQMLAIIAATIVTFTFGLDTIAMIQQLYTNPQLRDTIVGLAQTSDAATVASRRALLELPLGLRAPGLDSATLAAVPGYLLTIVALSLGAPFWFDLLKRLVNLRQSGAPPDERPRANAIS